MKRLLIAFAAAVLATLALGAATAKAADGAAWALTLNVSQTTIPLSGSAVASGALTSEGTGVAGQQIYVDVFAGGGCEDYLGSYSGAMTDVSGLYDYDIAPADFADGTGTYSVQASTESYEAVSDCIDITVATKVAPKEPVSEVGVFLCYSKWQVEPGVWPYGTAMALLKGGGYWLPYAVPGNPDYATNLGKYHLVCNLAATQSVSTTVMHSGGEVWSADYAKVIFGDAVGPLYPVVSGG